MTEQDNSLHENPSSILIVDDNPRNLQLISSLLKDQKHKLYITNSGENTLKFLENTIPDLILLDIMMPGMSGYEVCRIIKSQRKYRDIPVIFLTAKNETEDIVEGFKAGAVDYIVKPFNLSEVLARVNTHLQLRKTQQTLLSRNRELEQANQLLAESKTIIEQDAQNLARLNAEKNRFFSIIAHDLRSPLTGLTRISELILQKTGNADPEEVRKLARLLYDSSAQVFKLLENLLDWAKVQMNSLPFRPEWLPLRLLVSSAVYALDYDLKRKNLEFSLNVSEEFMVFADQSMLSTIIRNLVSNAVKFTPKGGKISISAKKTGNANLQIVVTDTGIGMDDQLLQKLFKLDQKISRSGTEGETSSGIGLLLCKDLVEKHHGTIEVTSKTDKGSTFIITLPYPETR
ncbi:MAG TPA: hybrid sensor histidine kinase/response regulator [Bacteroidales bacterium]|nr:hybrid sensor histidine kinase/response regulator [Bacteroidales bacterium]